MTISSRPQVVRVTALVVAAVATLLLAACTGDEERIPTPVPSASVTSEASPTSSPIAPATRVPREPTFAPDGRTGIAELDALIETVLIGNETDIAALYDGMARRSCYDSATGATEDRGLALDDWPALLAASDRALYSAARVIGGPPSTDYDIVFSVSNSTDQIEGWVFTAANGQVIDLRAGCDSPPAAFTQEVKSAYSLFLVLPPVADLPAAPSAHPLSVRTGVEPVDALLAVLESADAPALLAAVEYVTAECSETAAGRVRCDGSEEAGAAIEVLPWRECTNEPGILRRSVVEDRLPRIVTSDTQLHAVATIPDGFRVPADYSLLLVNDGQNPYDWRTDALYIRNGQIVAWEVGCAERVEALYPPFAYFVAPGGSYDGSPTGVTVVDQAVAAVKGQDLDALVAAVDWQPLGCLAPGVWLGIGQPPYCEGGEQPGDLVETFTFASCEGGPVRRDLAVENLGGLLDYDWSVYAIVDLGSPRTDSGVETRYQVVLVTDADVFAPVRSLGFVEAGMRIESDGCGTSDPNIVLQPGNHPDFLLSPPSDG